MEIEGGGGGTDWMWIMVVVASGIGAGIDAWVFLRKRGECPGRDNLLFNDIR